MSQSPPLKIAVIGSGAAGLAATWVLNEHSPHHVHLYETDGRWGGHANSVWFPKKGGDKGDGVWVDTGFIVFNPPTYPTFTSFLAHLGIPTIPTSMSFSVSRSRPPSSIPETAEWSSLSPLTLFAPPRSVFSLRTWGMIWDVVRWNAHVREVLRHDYAGGEGMSVGDYIEKERYGDAFVQDYLLPMTSSIWSTPATPLLRTFPIRTLARFMHNHNLLRFMPPSADEAWRTLVGGSRSYVNRIVDRVPEKQRHIATKVMSVRSVKEGVEVRCEADDIGTLYDRVIFATHSDTALSLLSDPTSLESELLKSFGWAKNEVVLHSDLELMPRRENWASWNCLVRGGESDTGEQVSLTYCMNILQHISEEKYGPVLATLNPPSPPAPETVIGKWKYDHPLLTAEAVCAQAQLPEIQWKRNIAFVGAWTKYGFHEDAFASGLRAALALPGVNCPFALGDPERAVGASWEDTVWGGSVRSVELGRRWSLWCVGASLWMSGTVWGIGVVVGGLVWAVLCALAEDLVGMGGKTSQGSQKPNGKAKVSKKIEVAPPEAVRESWQQRGDRWLSRLYVASSWRDEIFATSLQALFAEPLPAQGNDLQKQLLLMTLFRSEPANFQQHTPPMSTHEWNAMLDTFWNIVRKGPSLARRQQWLSYPLNARVHGACIFGLNIIGRLPEVEPWKWPFLDLFFCSAIGSSGQFADDAGLLLLKELTSYLGDGESLRNYSGYKHGRPLIRQLWSLAVRSWGRWSTQWTNKHHSLLLRTVREEGWPLDEILAEELRELVHMMQSRQDHVWSDDWQDEHKLYIDSVQDSSNFYISVRSETSSSWSPHVLLHLSTLFLHVLRLDLVQNNLTMCLQRTYGNRDVTPYQVQAFRAIASTLDPASESSSDVYRQPILSLVRELKDILYLYLVDTQGILTEREWERGPVLLYITVLQRVKQNIVGATREDLDTISYLLAAAFSRATGPGVCGAAFQEFWKTTFAALPPTVAYRPCLEPAFRFFTGTSNDENLPALDNVDISNAIVNYRPTPAPRFSSGRDHIGKVSSRDQHGTTSGTRKTSVGHQRSAVKALTEDVLPIARQGLPNQDATVSHSVRGNGARAPRYFLDYVDIPPSSGKIPRPSTTSDKAEESVPKRTRPMKTTRLLVQDVEIRTSVKRKRRPSL